MPRRGENIRKRKDGRWEARVIVVDEVNKEAKMKSLYAKTYKEVKEKLLNFNKDKEDKSPDPKVDHLKAVYFTNAADSWLIKVKKSKKHATYIKYYGIYQKYLKTTLKDMKIEEMTTRIVMERIDKIVDPDTTRSCSIWKSINCVINQIISFAEIHYNVKCPQISINIEKNPPAPIQVLSQAEQTRLLNNLYNDMDIYKLGILVCMSTGLRLGEICALKWSDIDFHSRTLTVCRTVQRIAVEGRDTKTMLLVGEPKSSFSKREIPLSDSLIQLLSLYRKSGGYVIKGNMPMEPRTYQNKFAKYLEQSNIESKNFHILRHTFATNCNNSGADVKSLSEILGHSDVRITLNRYVHPTIETKRCHINSLASIYGQYLGHTI